MSAPGRSVPTRLRARVVATFGRGNLVRDADHLDGPVLPATRRGRKGDVVVGDVVQCSCAHEQATIESIEPRRTLLFRADQFRIKELAANIDQVAIVFAPQPPFNPLFLWRALLAAKAADIASLLVLNKTDIAEGLDAARAAVDFGASLGVPTLSVSARMQPEVARSTLHEAFAGRTTLLVGQSGMGKSSLLNLLVDANARTQEYSRRLNVGKQTTTASRWFDLPGERGGALIDTPGFTAFGLAHLSLQQCATAMPDFTPFLGNCRFSNCRHLSEPGCAVIAAVERGDVQPQRHAFYRELADEIARQVAYP
jgi:ribosome biogenesis GTPase / thiamine phosphate phosphatase